MELTTVVLAPVYLPQDSTTPPPTREMEELVAHCRNQNWELIMGCDTNAHHVTWGSEDNNARVSTTWTVEDKGRLLVLLQQHGASNLELIQQNMPHKSISEIRYICDKHTRLALNEWDNIKYKNTQKDETVKNWLQVLKQINSHYKGSVHDIISRALKYIAFYEKRISTSHIDLRDCYLVLADISSGIAAKKLDESTNYFLFECLTKLAEALKKGETGSYKSHLRSLKNLYDLINNNKRKDKHGSVIVNPLDIPNNLLAMTEMDKQVDIFE